MTINKLQSKIIFIENEDITRDSSGGVMSYILNLSKYFISNNFNTVLIGSGQVNDVNVSNKRFSEFYSISSNASINNLKFFLKLFSTKALKNIDKNDVIHVQRPEMVIPLSLRTKNKIVCTLHGGQDIAVRKKKGKLIGSIYNILQNLSFLLVDQLIVVDGKNLNRYITKYPKIKNKISLIPISIDTNRFFPQEKLEARKKFNFSSDEKILLFIGRLEYEKNVAFIIDCFKNITKYNGKLIIAGTGSLKDILKENSKTHSDKIKFLGEIDNTQIPELINCADVMILASFFEGSPTVVKEALCCDVPVISTDVGDVKEVIESVNGGEIIGYNCNDFLTAIDKVFSKNRKKIDKASTLFNYNLMGEKTLTIYNKL